MVLTNVVLNYILIFGKFGFPVLGIAGARYRFLDLGSCLRNVLRDLYVEEGRL